ANAGLAPGDAAGQSTGRSFSTSYSGIPGKRDPYNVALNRTQAQMAPYEEQAARDAALIASPGELEALAAEDAAAGREAPTRLSQALGKAEETRLAAEKNRALQEDFATTDTRLRAQASQKAERYLSTLDERRAAAARDVHPGRLWANADQSERFGSLLAVLIGGFVSPKFGGKNQALEILNQAVERDIDAQMANIKNAKEDVRLGMDMYNLIVSKNDLDGKARQEAYLYKMEGVAKQLSAAMAGFAGADERLNAEALMGGINAEVQAAREKIQARELAQANEEVRQGHEQRSLSISAKNAETQSRSQEETARRNKAEEDAAKAPKPEDPADYLYSALDGAPVGKFRTNDQTTRREVTERHAKMEQVTGEALEVRDKLKAYFAKHPGLPFGSKPSSVKAFFLRSPEGQ
ncbi:MAG: hypothetical protein ACREJF_07465, partial [Candidatus Methylomirabilales bacterium]